MKFRGKTNKLLWNYGEIISILNGIQLRFSYDETKLKPSNLETNEITDDETEYFKFENEFSDVLELFTIPYAASENVIRAVISFDPPVTETEHIVEKDGIGKVVTTQGGVLLGKMSFHMTSAQFDISGFDLVEDTSSPTTGIKINIDSTNSYQHKKVVKFTDATASKDASLKDLIVSSGTKDGEEPTYKEYELTPTFEKDVKEYEITLLEYVDKINITAIQNDEKATMKIKHPKRDEDGNLVYEADGTTIVYEEKELLNNTEYTITLNELGKEDTDITIIVTAEDEQTTDEYKVKIKRPYGIIKGSIFLKPMKSAGIYKGTVRIYKSADVKTIIDWANVKTGKRDDIHQKLLTLDSIDTETNDDGTYEIYVIPGEYDILLDKTGYLDHIIISKTITEGETIDLGEKELLAGDINKDGTIQLLDLSALLAIYESKASDSLYKQEIDFNEDGKIQLVDLSILLGNYEKNREIE